MYKNFYDNILIGGTYSSIGFCTASKGDNLIISKNLYVEDYSPAFRFGMVKYNNNQGKALIESLGIKNGIVDMAQAAIEMYKLSEQCGFKILYQTFVSSITKTEAGFSVVVHNWDGTNIIHCKNVVNTQPTGNLQSKSLNALIECEMAVGKYDGYSITDAFYNGQKVLKLHLDVLDTMDKARLKLIDLLHTDALKGVRLILTSIEFDYTVSRWENNDIPSCNFENLVESYEKGFEMGASV